MLDSTLIVSARLDWVNICFQCTQWHLRDNVALHALSVGTICYHHLTSSLELFIEASYLEQEAIILIFRVIDLHDITDLGVRMLLWVQYQILCGWGRIFSEFIQSKQKQWTYDWNSSRGYAI